MTSIASLPGLCVVLQGRLPLARLGLTSVLEDDGRAIVIGEAPDAAALLLLCATWTPAVVVCELALPDLRPTAEACRAIRADVRIVALHEGRATDHASLAAELGLVLLSCAAGPELVRATVHGETAAPPRRGAERRAHPARVVSLVQRELLQLVSRGVSSSEAAALLGIDRTRAKRGMDAVQRCLGAGTIHQAVRRARRAGIVPAGPAPAPVPGSLVRAGTTWPAR